MKRTREHTAKEPQAKRTKIEQLLEVLDNVVQKFIAPFNNSGDAEVQNLEPDNEINSDDLEAAIAFSLIADVDADEESKKAEENLADKIVPYGHQETAQRIIMDFSLLWKNHFENFKTVPKDHYRTSPEVGVLRNKKIADYRGAIINDLDKLNNSPNETIFYDTLFNIVVKMLLIGHIYYLKSSHGFNLRLDCDHIDAIFAAHGLIEPMSKRMLEKHLETAAKYENVSHFVYSGQNGHQLIENKSLKFDITELAELKEKIASQQKGAVFKLGLQSLTFVFSYENQTRQAKDSLIAQDRNLFFMANQMLFDRNVPQELVSSIVLPSYNYCCVLKFSQENVTKLQDSFRKIHAARDSAQKPRLMSNK